MASTEAASPRVCQSVRACGPGGVVRPSLVCQSLIRACGPVGIHLTLRAGSQPPPSCRWPRGALPDGSHSLSHAVVTGVQPSGLLTLAQAGA